MKIVLKIDTTGLDAETHDIWRIMVYIPDWDETEIFNFRIADMEPSTDDYLKNLYGKDYAIKHQELFVEPVQEFFDFISEAIEESGDKLSIITSNAAFLKDFLMYLYEDYEQSYTDHFYSGFVDLINLAATAFINHRDAIPRIRLKDIAEIADVDYTPKIFASIPKTIYTCYKELVETIKDS